MPNLITHRPLWLAALVGLTLAWPPRGAASPAAVAALASLTAALMAAERAPTRVAVTLATVGAVGLGGAAVGQRLDEPDVGLAVAIGATLSILHAANRERVHVAGPTITMLAMLLLPDAVGLPRLAAVGAVLLAAALATPSARSAGELAEVLLVSPARLLVVSFVALAGLGAGLLALPAASTGAPISPIDAIFTAVSATCVTGLAVLDTPNALTFFGQAVVLLLIQAGGLGMMTFATAGALWLGRRLAVRHEIAAAQLVGVSGARRDLARALRVVLLVTGVSELAGAAALTAMFWWGGDAPLAALWRGVFTSISAFCNAGFALQSDSLMGYADRPLLLVVIGLIIAAGGLGPAVIVTLPAAWRGRAGVQARVVLWVSAGLTVVPALLFLALEWRGTLGDMGLLDKLVNAWFSSVTLRTAGFNSIDYGAIHPATWTICLICMFIGGSPGSTAGGVKTTTFAVVVLTVLAAVRGRTQVEVFGRAIPHRTVYEAAAITAVGVAAAAGLIMALQVTQALPLDQLVFEAVSALGTVGLSMGATARLDDVGKVLITLAMFAGRVGPLTLFLILVEGSERRRLLPSESLQVG